jgi:hypothetical protein
MRKTAAVAASARRQFRNSTILRRRPVARGLMREAGHLCRTVANIDRPDQGPGIAASEAPPVPYGTGGVPVSAFVAGDAGWGRQPMPQSETDRRGLGSRAAQSMTTAARRSAG